MVCFECSKCNETIKKPKLARHLEMCGSFWVSCIDCNKVFAWDAWDAHTSCVSEAQKYQGNLFQAKESSNKGQVKQDMWIDNVAKRIADPDSGIHPATKSLLENLMGFNNIPRKQKPFGNFVKNSLKIWDDRKIGEMWEVICAANVKPAAPVPAAAAKPAEANGTKVEVSAKRQWPGWRQAVDEELLTQDGKLSWQKLREVLVARYKAEAENVNGASQFHLGCQALAEIPESYLSQEDNLVRLPPKKKQC